MGTAPFASAHADLFTENDVNTIKAGIKGNGVLSGCAVSWTSGLTVTVAAGLVLENGLTVAIAEGAVVLTPDSSLPMMATIYATGGVITVQYGDPAAVVKKTATDTFFQYYAPIPATLTTGIILAQVYIPPTGDMDATMVLDKRILLESPTITITQANLYAAISASALRPNAWYLVSDYKNYALIPSSSPAAYYEGATEAILLRATSANTVATDGYSATYPKERIFFKQTVPSILANIDGAWDSGGSTGANEISSPTQYGFTIDDQGHHFSMKDSTNGWYLECYDQYGSSFSDYGEASHSLYSYLDSLGTDTYSYNMKITGAETFHVETRGLKISDYADDDSFYIHISDGANPDVDLYYADLGVRFTFDDNGDFAYLDGATNPIDLTQLQANGGYIEMGYSSTSMLTTIGDDGVAAIPAQGVIYIDQRNIVYNVGEYGAIDSATVFFNGSRPFQGRKPGTFAATFYDPSNDITITLTDADEGDLFTWDNDNNYLTLTDPGGLPYTGGFDFNNVDFSDQSNFAIYWEFEAMDLTRGSSSIYISWYYVAREINGQITARENPALGFKCAFDYRGRVVRRYKCSTTDWAAGTYNAGDVRRYNGGIYACYRNGTTANPGDVNYWALLFNDDYYMQRDFTLRIGTSNTAYVSASVIRDTAVYQDAAMFDLATFDGLAYKLNTEITAYSDDMDMFIASSSIANLQNNSIYCGNGDGTTILGACGDNSITTTANIITTMNYATGLFSGSFIRNISACNVGYMNGCYIYYMNKCNATYIESYALFGSAQATTFGYITNSTGYYGNTNYNNILYMDTVLYKSSFNNNIICSLFTQNSFASVCTGNLILGNFTTNTFAQGVTDNTFGGTVIRNTIAGALGANKFGVGMSDNTGLGSWSGNVCTGNVSNNNCPGMNFQYNQFGNSCSGNTGTGSGTVYYNQFGYSFNSNSFANGASSITIRNNVVQTMESCTFNSSSVLSYNSVGYRISGCTFRASANVSYNRIGNQLYNSTFGSGTGLTYFNYNSLYGAETSTFGYNFTENTGFDTISGYTANMALANRVFNKNPASYVSYGYNDLEAVHSVLQIYGALATRYLRTNGANSLNKNFGIVDVYANNNNQTLPAANTCGGRIYYVKRTAATGSTTILPSGSDTIDGAASLVLGVQYDAVVLASDGVSMWTVLAKNMAEVPKIVIPATGLPIYASDGTTLVAQFDGDGRLYVKGGVYS